MFKMHLQLMIKRLKWVYKIETKAQNERKSCIPKNPSIFFKDAKTSRKFKKNVYTGAVWFLNALWQWKDCVLKKFLKRKRAFVQNINSLKTTVVRNSVMTHIECSGFIKNIIHINWSHQTYPKMIFCSQVTLRFCLGSYWIQKMQSLTLNAHRVLSSLSFSLW